MYSYGWMDGSQKTLGPTLWTKGLNRQSPYGLDLTDEAERQVGGCVLDAEHSTKDRG